MGDKDSGGREGDHMEVTNAIFSALNAIDNPELDENIGNLKRKHQEDEDELAARLKKPQEELISPPIAEAAAQSNAASSSMGLAEEPGEENQIPKSRPRYYLSCINNSYESFDRGPYFLYIENVSSRKRVHPMFIGKLIRLYCPDIYNNILAIQKIDSLSVKIEVNNYVSANRLKNVEFWKENNLVAFIPNFLVYRQGIIRDVDYSLSDEEIMTYIDSCYKVTNARRIFKKGQDKRVPTPLVVLTFRSQSLPVDIKILEVCCKVDSFKQRVIQCSFCLGFGHYQNRCSSVQPHCSRCAGAHSLLDCQASVSLCCNCKGGHCATDPKCPEFIRQVNIKQLVTESCISFKEAAILVNNKKSYANKASSTKSNSEILATVDNNQRQTIHVGKNNNTNSQVKTHKIITIHSPPRVPIKMQAPQFQLQENISNTINPSTPITTSPYYMKNINNHDRFKYILNNVLSKIISNEITIERFNLSLEDKEFFINHIHNAINCNDPIDMSELTS